MNPLSAWALRAASILREGGDEGVEYAVLRDELGRPPWSILEELKRHGYVVGEQHYTFFLVVDPVSSEPVASAAPPCPVSPGAPEPPGATGSLGTGQLTIDEADAA